MMPSSAKHWREIVTSWNKSAERIFGYTAEEMIGKPIETIFPDDRKQEEPRILARLRAGERVDHFETIRKTKDGRLLNVSVTISPVRDENGVIVGASKIARDITQQKQFQEELQRARDAAVAARISAEAAKAEADKARKRAEKASRAKDHFLSVLSHELRTPLTPVLGAVSLMEELPNLPPEIAENIAMIRRNVETEARLVDDLLDITRIVRGKLSLHFEVCDIHGMIRNALGMLQGLIDEKQLAVTTTLRAVNRNIWCDVGRFQQILLNLLSNATKFTPKFGSIGIATSNENGHVKIEISDSGIGISPEVKARLFQPFEQGEQTRTRQFGGLGLGLSIVKSLIDLHKGSISVKSEGEGKGATFILRIATVQTEVGGSAGNALAKTEIATLGLRVLLVEDHADTREILAKFLKSLGCEVTAVGTVQEAMAVVCDGCFDLLLSDIGLPDGTGLDVMRKIRAQKQIRGIALSGYGQEDDLVRSREAGFESHLIKPVNPTALHDAIRRMMS